MLQLGFETRPLRIEQRKQEVACHLVDMNPPRPERLPVIPIHRRLPVPRYIADEDRVPVRAVVTGDHLFSDDDQGICASRRVPRKTDLLVGLAEGGEICSSLLPCVDNAAGESPVAVTALVKQDVGGRLVGEGRVAADEKNACCSSVRAHCRLKEVVSASEQEA